jgi:hypothetical protein
LVDTKLTRLPAFLNSPTPSKEAQQRGIYHFDSYARFGSYTKLTALGLNGDGVHPDNAIRQLLGNTLISELGFDKFINADNLIELFIDVLHANRGLALGNTGKISPEPIFGFDLDYWAKRWHRFTGEGGSIVAQLDSGTNGGQSFLPALFRLGDGGPHLVKAANNMVRVAKSDNSNFTGDLQVRAIEKGAIDIFPDNGLANITFEGCSVNQIYLSADVVVSIIKNPEIVSEVQVSLIQYSGSPKLVTVWPSAFRFAGGVPPTLSTTSNSRDIFTFRYDAGGYYEISRTMNVH